MALDRQSIEKRDFPIGRRGYDPDAVDAHLASLADEFDTLRRSSTRQRDTLASAASEQVRMIVEAAEQSAADIEREAELEARRIRQDAREAAEKLRNDAGQQAREHVQRVTEVCAMMLERIEGMDSEVRTLVDNLRSGAGRLSSDLALLQGAVGDLRGGAVAGFSPETLERVPAASAGAAAEPAVAEPEPEPEYEPEPEPEAAARAPEAKPAKRRKKAPEPEPEADASDGGGSADEEGARLIALNMALNGTPREETEQYLADHFELSDPQALLDDVYARAGQ